MIQYLVSYIKRGDILADDNRSNLVVRIDKELHQQIKIICATKNIQIRDYIIDLIEKDIEKRNEKE